MFGFIGLIGAAIAAWFIYTGVRDLRLVQRLLDAPAVEGTVISSQVHRHTKESSSGGRSVTTTLVETIEFVSTSGRQVRGTPAVAESEIVDRTGLRVTVHADPDNSDVFIAPIGEHFQTHPIMLKMAFAGFVGVVMLCMGVF